MCAILPFGVFAADISIGTAVQTETTTQGNVVFSYQLDTESPLTLKVACADADNKFFLEDSGTVLACGTSFEIPHPNSGGKITIMPYVVHADTDVTYTLTRTTPSGETENVAVQSMTVYKTDPAPLFTNVTVRQTDPVKPEVRISWNTLEKANMSLVVSCDATDLVLIDKHGSRYACNQRIELGKNVDEGDMTLQAENTTSREGLLFTFIAERDGKVGALKNISFTFETTTEVIGTGETEQGIITRLWQQVHALLAVVTGLFR